MKETIITYDGESISDKTSEGIQLVGKTIGEIKVEHKELLDLPDGQFAAVVVKEEVH